MFAMQTLRGSSPQTSSSEGRSRSTGSARSNGTGQHRSQDAATYRHRTVNPYQRIVDEMVAEEHNIRKGLRAVDGHPEPLLRFCSSCIEVALTLLDQSASAQGDASANQSASGGGTGADALQTAYAIACHVETLLRHGVESRRRYNHEDWLNLCRAVVRKMQPEEASAIEAKRVALLAQTLQVVSRVCLMRNEVSDSLSAFEDSMAASGTTLADCRLGTLLNYLSISEKATSTAADAMRTLRLASDAVALAEHEVQSIIAEADILMRHGAPSERQRLMERRADVGRMVVTARLRQAVASALCQQLQQAAVASGSRRRQEWTWPLHVITLMIASLEAITESEVDPGSPLQRTVHEAVERWSLWMAHHPSRHASAEVYMQPADRWRYQCLQSRQWSALQNYDLPDDGASAVGYVRERNPMLLGLTMLRMAGAMPRAALATTAVTTSPAVEEEVATVPLPRPTMSFRQERRRRDSGGSLALAMDNMPSASAEVPLLLAQRRSGSIEDDGLSSGRRGQAAQSEALRNFTRRAFDICHNYLLPTAGPAAASSRSHSAADGDDVVPSTGSSPCPLPPPQPVAPIRASVIHFKMVPGVDHGASSREIHRSRSSSNSNGTTQDDHALCLSLPRCAQSVSPPAVHVDVNATEGVHAPVAASVPADAVAPPTKPASLPRRRMPVVS